MKLLIFLVIVSIFVSSVFGQCLLLRGLLGNGNGINRQRNQRNGRGNLAGNGGNGRNNNRLNLGNGIINLPPDYIGTLFYNEVMKLKGANLLKNTLLAIAEQLNDFENDMLDINYKRVKLDKNKFTKEEQIELGKLFQKFRKAAPRLRESLLKFVDDLGKLDSIWQIPTILTKEMKDATIDLMKLIKEIISKRVLPSEFIPRTTKFLTDMKLLKAFGKDIYNLHQNFFNFIPRVVAPDYSDDLFE